MAKVSLKDSLAGFKDPTRRPRYVIWMGVVVLALVGFVVFAFGATSTYWFCNELCHSVQDDAMNTYRMGSHVMVNCLSCHEPVNADPVTFAYYKAKAGIIGAYQLYTKTNETPLNPESELALNTTHMDSGQCTQCHSENRVVSPSSGIRIDHAVHEEKEIQCTICHNRVAHPERDYEMVCLDPKTGEVSEKHADFMTMTACFRCHTLTEPPPDGMKAPGTCSSCHPADFELKPANHKEPGFMPSGHADLAMAPLDRSTGRPDTEAEPSEEASGEALPESSEASGEAEAEAAEAEESEYTGSGEESHIFPISPVEEVDYCSTCHVVDTFCNGCHGVEMPHPEGFADNHGAAGEADPAVCSKCHAQGELASDPTSTEFCNNCHHSGSDPARPWLDQHDDIAKAEGAAQCFECHNPVSCAECHVRGGD